MGTALLIRNAGKPADALAPALARLEAGGVETIAPECESAEAAQRAISRYAAEVDLVIVAGGDGTLNSAAPALMDAGKPLGILPMGTANDLARTLEIPREPEAAAELILAGRTRRIDLGVANGKPFFNVATVGLGAEVAEALDGGEKRLGRVAYWLSALRVLTHARTFPVEVRIDGRPRRIRSYHLAVGNGRYHGGGLTVRHDAEIDDGKLSLYSLGPGSLWKAVVLAPIFWQGRHVRWREVDAARAAEIQIRTPQPRPVNLDGDLTTCTPLTVTVARCAIEVYA